MLTSCSSKLQSEDKPPTWRQLLFCLLHQCILWFYFFVKFWMKTSLVSDGVYDVPHFPHPPPTPAAATQKSKEEHEPKIPRHSILVFTHKNPLSPSSIGLEILEAWLQNEGQQCAHVWGALRLDTCGWPLTHSGLFLFLEWKACPRYKTVILHPSIPWKLASCCHKKLDQMKKKCSAFKIKTFCFHEKKFCFQKMRWKIRKKEYVWDQCGNIFEWFKCDFGPAVSILWPLNSVFEW